MQQSKEDGATVAIYFESRLAKLSLNAEELPHIDAEVDELAEGEEDSQQAILKSRWAALEKVVGAEPRVASVAADLVSHFEERNKAQTGKAMVSALILMFILFSLIKFWIYPANLFVSLVGIGTTTPVLPAPSPVSE